MTRLEMLKWVPCDSRSDMEARASGENILGLLLTSDANTWGYIQTPDARHLNIGYANIGLTPQAVLVGQRMFVGINECLIGYDYFLGETYFSYRMPLVFHEFVEIGNPLIVRDEIGFIGIDPEGSELWKFCTEGIIENYTATPSKISGRTMDGSSFSFEIPMM
jgi:hypothetical protein